MPIDNRAQGTVTCSSGKVPLSNSMDDGHQLWIIESVCSFEKVR
jgi:hypothetical protein